MKGTRFPRVMFVVADLEIGGVERLVADWAVSLRREGSECSVLCINRKKGPLVLELEKKGVAVYEVSQHHGGALGFFWNLVRFFRSTRPDVVHSQCPWALPLQVFAARIGGASRFILTIHSAYQKRTLLAEMRRRMLMKFARSHMTAIVSVSEEVRRHSISLFGLRDADVVTICNGIDTELFKPLGHESVRRDLRVRLGLPLDAFLVACVAGLREEKDHVTLLKAVRDLSEAGVWLVLAGDGPERGRLEQMAHELNIRERVMFLGVRDDIPDLLRAVDVFVSPSQREGCSLAIAEAMATGLPVVATRVGGTKDLIIDGRNGLLVNPGRPHEMADAIRQVMLNNALAGRLGMAARETVVRQFGRDQCLRAYRMLYFGSDPDPAEG